ncbi:primosomal protein N' [Nocardia sp. NPDC050697]|uniref:primosomal protein N' n=1 Tax=Nocardia sp. NPDC050697 TaxID=3155158 RepID=UPI0033DB2ECE
MLPLLTPAHLDRDFDYLIPPEYDAVARPGVRVRIRFAGRLVDGYLLARLDRSDHEGTLRPLERVVSPEQVLTPEIERLVRAVAARYAGTRADVLRLAIPPRHARTEAKAPKVGAAVAVSNEDDAAATEADSLAETNSAAAEAATPAAPPEVTAAPHDSPQTAQFAERGPGEVGGDTDGTSTRNPQIDEAAWSRYTHGPAFLTAITAQRNPRAAWQALPGENWPRRLAELAALTDATNRGTLLLVPDQRDLDRVLAECQPLLGDRVVGLAAGLGPSARYRRWLAALRGTATVVVGTRSAVFAPVRNLGLIAIWDDGDDTFAEPRAPYPHAREVALLRAHETGAAFVAAGFARTAEIQAVVDSGWAHDLVADRAVLREHTPHISAPGDSDIALERDPVARAVRIPGVAFAAARAALKEGAPVLVQVPRRGYVPALACARCRTPARCRRCNGPLALPEHAGDGAHSPACRWCGSTEAAFRCPVCAARALRAVVIGAQRTAEELGRAFPDVPIRGSGGGAVLDSVEPGPQVVVATVGAEPRVRGGYGVGLLLDGWALLTRADLRATEDTLRRWTAAAALVRPHGRVIVMADPAVPTVQALVRWDPVGHARAELAARAEVGFPPAVRLAAVDGTAASVAELLAATALPDGVQVLGPVPLPESARPPFAADSSAPVERLLLRVPRSGGAALARALTAAQAVRSTQRSDAPLRVQIDPVDIG